VTAAGRLGAVDDAALASVLDALGLAVEAVAPPPVPEPPPAEPEEPDDWDEDDDEDEEPVAEDATPEAAIGATVDYVDDTAPMPDWMAGVEAITFGPMRARVAVEPPLPDVQARAAMVVAAATRRPGRKLDIGRLIERAARVQPLAPAPILSELRTAASVQLLIDAGEAMEPYAADVAFLEDRFLEVAGSDRVEVHTFTGTPLRGADPDALARAVEPWERPPPRSLVVVVSELGVGGPPLSRDRARPAEWREFAAEVAECDAFLRVLTPFPAARWPSGLAALAHVTNWESLVDLVEHRA
jgi:hypothetical protein